MKEIKTRNLINQNEMKLSERPPVKMTSGVSIPV